MVPANTVDRSATTVNVAGTYSAYVGWHIGRPRYRQPVGRCWTATRRTGQGEWSSEMTVTTVWITPGEAVTVHVPTFPHHGEGAADELEALYDLPAHSPNTDDDTPVFIAPWQRGGDKIRPDRKTAWCKALCSGRYRQILGRFRDTTDGRCAMGVLRDLARKSNEESLLNWLGLSADAYGRLYDRVIEMNDREGKSFSEIADYIGRAW